MNIERMTLLAEKLEDVGQFPEMGFNMVDYIDRDGYNRDTSGHSCETTACIAGWAHWISLGMDPNKLARLGLNSHVVAQDWLGLTDKQAGELFLPDGEELAPYGLSYNSITPWDAAKVVRRAADTGTIDWSAAAIEGGAA